MHEREERERGEPERAGEMERPAPAQPPAARVSRSSAAPATGRRGDARPPREAPRSRRHGHRAPAPPRPPRRRRRSNLRRCCAPCTADAREPRRTDPQHGQMIDPPAERSEGRRMSATPMTLRADSAQLVADRGDNAAESAYYFYGRARTTSTVTARTRSARSRATAPCSSAASCPAHGQAHERIMGTLVHERSHIIVNDYGEHPRHGERRRALRPLQGRVPRLLRRAARYLRRPRRRRPRVAIRDHLVGTNATPAAIRPRNAYWAGPAGHEPFRAQVAAHMRPDGFNLDNSP